MEKVFVNVNWQGKKAINLPDGMRYITVARFSEDINWPHEAWSIVLEFNTPPIKQGNPSKGMAHFLVADAPYERLIEGKDFELYEGGNLVAKVVIENT